MTRESMNRSIDTTCKIKPFILEPVGKDYLWGGDRLAKEFGKDTMMHPLAESWECSTHPDGVSIVGSGFYQGKPLDELIAECPEILGTHPSKISGEGVLPIMVKLIDAKEQASIQVHPDDAFAKIYENGENGKSEMWYVLEADRDSKLVYGFRRDMNKEMVRGKIEEGNLEKYVRKIKVKKDDVFYVAPGCVHAIGSGIVLAEIQQNSNVTYRLFDYNRKDKDGKERELHIEKALQVANLKADSEPRQPMRMVKYQPGCASELLCRCKYFQVERMLVHCTQTAPAHLHVNEESFVILLCLEGKGCLSGEEKLELQKGRCVFLPAGCGNLSITGKMQFLKIRC